MTHTPRERAAWSLAIFMVLVYALVPVMWMISLSLKPADKLSTERGFFYGIFHPDFDNYDTIFSGNVFTKPLVNSIGIAAIATFIAILLAAMAAYALSRLDFPGKTLILSGALAVAMFPPISIVGSLFNIWRDIGLYDMCAGLLIHSVAVIPQLAIYTLSAYFREVSCEQKQ